MIGLTACGQKYTLEESDINVNSTEVQEVSMVISDQTLTSTGVVVEVVNNSDVLLVSGNEHDFLVQVEKDGQWSTLVSKEELANTDEALLFSSDNTVQLFFDWEYRYGELKDGHYRIVKRFWPDNNYDTQYYIAAEFIIE